MQGLRPRKFPPPPRADGGPGCTLLADGVDAEAAASCSACWSLTCEVAPCHPPPPAPAASPETLLWCVGADSGNEAAGGRATGQLMAPTGTLLGGEKGALGKSGWAHVRVPGGRRGSSEAGGRSKPQEGAPDPLWGARGGRWADVGGRGRLLPASPSSCQGTLVPSSEPVNHSRKWLRGPQEAGEVECRPALHPVFCWGVKALGLLEQRATPGGRVGGLQTVETEAPTEPGGGGAATARVRGLASPGGSAGEPVPGLSPASGGSSLNPGRSLTGHRAAPVSAPLPTASCPVPSPVPPL